MKKKNSITLLKIFSFILAWHVGKKNAYVYIFLIFSRKKNNFITETSILSYNQISINVFSKNTEKMI